MYFSKQSFQDLEGESGSIKKMAALNCERLQVILSCEPSPVIHLHLTFCLNE